MLNISELKTGYGQSEVIHTVSFGARKTEILAIMGRNGMGKTTLLKSLMGLLPVKGGKIELNGQDITNLEPYERVKHGLAFVPQGRMIFPDLTVLDNIKTGLENSKTREIPADIFALFPVLHEMRHRKGGNLSGGQQQQLAIARALVTEPKVLILDEPTEGIQPSIIKDIARVLREIRRMRDLTILVTEQVLSFTLDICDRLLVIDGGRFTHEATRPHVDANRIKQLLAV